MSHLDALDNAYEHYLESRLAFIVHKEIHEDSALHLKRQTELKRHTPGSRKWYLKLAKIEFWRHYKMRHSYVLGHYFETKRAYKFSYSVCNWMNSRQGKLYAVQGAGEDRLYLFSGHFFDRLAQRRPELNRTKDDRADLIKEMLRQFRESPIGPGRDPLLLDPNGQAYLVMPGGYATGHHRFVDGKEVCFFKTFLSDAEIDEERWMENLMLLYRVGAIVDALIPPGLS